MKCYQVIKNNETLIHEAIWMNCKTLFWVGISGGSEDEEFACNMGDLNSVPGLGRSPGEENGNPLQFLAWKTPWTEEPGGSIGLQRTRHDWATSLSLSFWEILCKRLHAILFNLYYILEQVEPIFCDPPKKN